MFRKQTIVWTIISILALLPLPLFAAADDDVNKHDVSMTALGPGVKNVSEEIRNVPIHPDDIKSGYWSSAGPVARTSYNNPFMVSIGHTLYRTHRGNRGVSARVRWIIYPFANQINIAERNYTNAPGTGQRGYGAALTYVGMEARGVIPAISRLNGDLGFLNIFTNFTPEVEWRTPLKIGGRERSLIFSLTYFQLEAVTGWDRYDHLEEYKRYTLAHCVPLTISLDLGRVRVGAQVTFAFGRGVDPVTPSLNMAWSW